MSISSPQLPLIEQRAALSRRRYGVDLALRPLARGPLAIAATAWGALDRVAPGAAARLPYAAVNRHMPGLPAPAGTDVRHVKLPGCQAEVITATGAEESEHAVIYLHGGAFFLGSPRSHRRLAARVSAHAQARVHVVDYRLAPGATIADQVQDGLDAYCHALRHAPEGGRVAIAGDSAGGMLAVAVALAARNAQLPMPAGIVAMSPWIDLVATVGPETSADALFPRAFLPAVRRYVLGTKADLHSSVSPADAALEGLPSTMVLVGAGEHLRGDAERLASRLAQSSVPCRLQVWAGQPHVFPFLGDVLPEGRAALQEIGEFLQAQLND